MNSVMKKIYISENAFSEVKYYLASLGFRLSEVRAQTHIDTGISAHPDIYMCKLGVSDESPVFMGNPDKLSSKYPGDVLYNAACSGKYFIYHKNYTDKDLVKAALKVSGSESDKRTGCCGALIPVPVRQGYVKCSTAIVDEESFITSDQGIARALTAKGAEVLLIRPGHIDLPGYDYGFIGGTCGRVGNEVIFNGDLSLHPDFEKIRDFISSRGLKPVYFKGLALTDIGSIITSVK